MAAWHLPASRRSVAVAAAGPASGCAVDIPFGTVAWRASTCAFLAAVVRAAQLCCGRVCACVPGAAACAASGACAGAAASIGAFASPSPSAAAAGWHVAFCSGVARAIAARGADTAATALLAAATAVLLAAATATALLAAATAAAAAAHAALLAAHACAFCRGGRRRCS